MTHSIFINMFQNLFSFQDELKIYSEICHTEKVILRGQDKFGLQCIVELNKDFTQIKHLGFVSAWWIMFS